MYQFEWGYEPELLYKDQYDNIILLSDWEYRFDDEKWRSIRLPFFTDSKKQIHLRTKFKADNLDIQNLKLVSNGILGSAGFYLNDKFFHFQSNDDIAFEITIPPSLIQKDSENILTVQIKEAALPKEGYPHIVNLLREKNFYGILKPLFLGVKKTPVIRLEQSEIDFKSQTPVLSLAYAVDVEKIIPKNARRIVLEETLLDQQGGIIGKKSSSVAVSETVKRNVDFELTAEHLWSPENTGDLIVTIQVKVDLRIMRIERKAIKARHLVSSFTGIQLNGNPLKIRGLNFHRNPLVFANGNYYNTIQLLLKNIQQRGFNAIRFLHHTPDPLIFHIADSLGLLIFAELPIWRYPATLFSNDFLMEHAKISIRNLQYFYSKHVSFTSLGIGQEIPLDNPASQKFMLILKTLNSTHLKNPCYLSPLFTPEPFLKDAADFYIFDAYLPVRNASFENLELDTPFHYFGKIGFINDYSILESNLSNLDKKLFYAKEIKSVKEDFGFHGGFIESAIDWYSEYPTHISEITEDGLHKISDGLFNIESDAVYIFGETDNIWERNENDIAFPLPEIKKTNFFSILLFLALILFLAIYRKNKRLQENLKRSLIHPYGFFVDMRERRIIPLFNSIISGSFSALILGAGCASFFYFYRNSFKLHEIMSIFLIPMDIFDDFLSISHSAVMLTLVFTVIFLLYPLFISIILKLISLFTREKIRYRQALAIGLWSGIPFFILLPVSMMSFQVIYNQHFENILLIVLCFFLIWTHIRMINGIRVLFFARPMRVLIIILLSYLVPLLIFWAVFHPEFFWYEYLKLMLKAGLHF
ncbi:MAG: hypothetical protein JXR46_07245 [Calditrichaceae bacterium]|nr:hypothetical protein [Calditrichaceae bacterium]MBN2708825.1 hypothetical protein [Calditrichaceae bacterium]RQV97646.1 MAG: hypothetical protein EH224_01110 [Calditrichota bacterium]